MSSDTTRSDDTCSLDSTCGAIERAMDGQGSDSLRVLTYNIRFDCKCPPTVPLWGLRDEQEFQWTDRRERVANVIKQDVAPDVSGFQEVKAWQAADLSCLLGSEWRWIGESRSGPDGYAKVGEFTAGVIGTIAIGALSILAFQKLLGGGKGARGKKEEKEEGEGKREGRRWLMSNALLLAGLAYDVAWQTGGVVKGCSYTLRHFYVAPVIGTIGALVQIACLSSEGTRGIKRIGTLMAVVFAVVYSYGLVVLLVIPMQYGDEYGPIFFDNNKVVYEGNGNTTWLNRDDIPGKIASEWGAGCTRVATYGTFSKRGGEERSFNFINTHLDHVGDMARTGGAQIIVKRIVPWLNEANNFPVVLTGDFNTYVASPAWYQFNSSLADTHFFAEEVHEGPIKSFNAFRDEEECGRAIDWIWVSRKGLRVKTHKSKFYEGQVSDHNPVWADMELIGEETVSGKENFQRTFSSCRRRGGG